MQITLKTSQRQWLADEVARGRFASIESAVEAAIASLIDDDHSDLDDAWVAPLLDEARAEVARGETMSLDEFKTHAARRLAQER